MENQLLKILLFNQGTFVSDYSIPFFKFGSDKVLSLDSVNYLLIGFKKPISNIYLDISSIVSTDTARLKLEYYNGGNWINEDLNLLDLTQNAKSSDFIYWNKEINNEIQTIEDYEGYFYKLSFNESVQITSKYLGLVFNTLEEIKSKFPIIDGDNFLGNQDILPSLISAKDAVCKSLNATPWDIMEISEVRLASIYYCLYEIFYNYSDREDDIYMKKAKDFYNLYESNLVLAETKVDRNNDGKFNEGDRETKVYSLWR